MADVKIRNLDNRLVDYYRRRAAEQGVSLEEELRQALADERRRAREDAFDEIGKHIEAMRRRYGELPDSTPGIRAERDGDPEA
jgi:plasmid stability protein